ncbi:DNA (Cytosine-5)-methyltransferase DRM2 [Quillaja saponaria]|uniref:DNA (Cytosine-5)-methyltransferase DRM2 n=1 Tax=Quillaja saponaria TaxID=32244 RepID=A0AAD7LBZ4_QUISA|nr:DNA (Cytosine-5)-methyltransferase DRM2 [Quillaja saponaria]
MSRHSNGQSSLDQEGNKAIVPKAEVLDFELPPQAIFSRDVGDNVASSSGSNLRAFFIGMGFLPSLVDKVIEENGEDNADLLLETLFTYSALQKSNSESSDSLDSLFDDDNDPTEVSAVIKPKEEPDELNEVADDKRASLLVMNFSVKEVEFAMDKLGEDAPVHELVDFIIAAQIAEKIEKEAEDTAGNEVKNEDNNEKLFGTMEKTLCLLEMGFSENEISSAIERLGSEAPIQELADSIVVDQNGTNCVRKYEYCENTTGCRPFSVGMEYGQQCHPYNTIKVKSEEFSREEPPQSRDVNLEETYKGKRPKEEFIDEIRGAASQMRYSHIQENRKGKRPKQEFDDGLSSFLDPYWGEEEVDTKAYGFGIPNNFNSNSCRSLNRVVAKPPYFFYGNISNISYDSWAKISQFLYAVEPEFVNTQFFSAMSRKEGYVHNLPTENRFYILPEPPMTIQDAIPHTKKWWPSWDTRKQVSCISSEIGGMSQLCDRLGRILADSQGVLSSEQQRDILHHCRGLNLVWVGRYKLSHMAPEHLEHILGYPLNHTLAAESSLIERLQSLKHCFQTDTLGYHISVMKSMFPGGLTMLSLYGGIGGAEIALHRLGVHLKAVVSVETSEAKRKILKRWWCNTWTNWRIGAD